MAKRNAKRPAIISLYLSGGSAAFISKVLKVPRRTVYDAIKRYKELGTLSDRTGRGRKLTVITPEMIKKIRERIRRNPRRSMRKMARELHISVNSVRTIVRRKLRMYPYRIQRVHMLTERMKAQRLQRCKKLLKRFANGTHRAIVFSDEKVFTLDPVVNRQNDRILSQNIGTAIRDGKLAGKTAHPASVMVWGAITSNGKSPLVFVESGVKIKKDEYQKTILEDVLKPWANAHFGNNRWCFQQDSAPAHKARTTQQWCKRELPDFIAHEDWPSNSPDLNPLDFSVWSVIESKVCSTRHASLDSLKASLIEAWNEMSEDYLRATCDAFVSRLRTCVHKKGGHFE